MADWFEWPLIIVTALFSGLAGAGLGQLIIELFRLRRDALL